MIYLLHGDLIYCLMSVYDTIMQMQMVETIGFGRKLLFMRIDNFLITLLIVDLLLLKRYCRIISAKYVNKEISKIKPSLYSKVDKSEF